jgi:two-component system, chemotaxis family, chemotaxis protein CheY
MKKILVVHDSITEGQELRESLENQNYQVTTVFSSIEAQLELIQSVPDLIILTHCLPNADGIVLCKTLKQIAALNRIPIIVFSSENKLENMMKAYEAGADYYIIKEADGNKVLRVLADSLFTRGARRKQLAMSA